MKKYVIQRRFRTELMEKVGGALDKIFEHVNGKSLHVCETISEIEAPKPLTKKQIDKICKHLLTEALKEGWSDTLSFEVVPFEKSMEAQAQKEVHRVS